jgi:hypothetical protein
MFKSKDTVSMIKIDRTARAPVPIHQKAQRETKAQPDAQAQPQRETRK